VTTAAAWKFQPCDSFSRGSQRNFHNAPRITGVVIVTALAAHLNCGGLIRVIMMLGPNNRHAVVCRGRGVRINGSKGHSMKDRIQNIVIVGGGSAGFLAAVAFQLRLPHAKVTVVHAPNIPVIGVGESTTRGVAVFLHDDLRFDRAEFFREVQPSWKLGLRLEWGDPRDTHFNYPFDRFIDTQLNGLEKLAAFYCLSDCTDASLYSALMDRKKAPCVDRAGGMAIDDRTAYHIKNELFIAYLRRKSEQQGAKLVEGEVVDVQCDDDGDVASLRLADGREITGDLFLDCSGFRSLLLNKTRGEKYVSYSDALFCDAAVIGSWDRDDEVLPYTTIETMNHGWCWRIDFIDVVTRGYVYSSAFCSDDEAMREMKQKNPQLGDDLRVIKFPSGRYENYWVGNVVGIGNASGFIEPLEATALHLIIEQCRFVTEALVDSDGRIVPAMQQVENQRFRAMWDDVRDFLALHYRFNRKLDTPFWRHCQEHSKLGKAEELVEYFRLAGPSALSKKMIDPNSMFGYSGYMTMLVGQRVATEARSEMTSAERQIWDRFLTAVRHNAEMAMPMRPALQQVYDPNFTWPKGGR
jgi:tryptophan halogenase